VSDQSSSKTDALAPIHAQRSITTRALLALLGILATAIGVVGIWLPGLPTTPFILLALWVFARSSERLSAWMRRTPLLRTAIEEADRFARERTLPLGIKIVAQSMAWASTLFTWLVSGSLWLTLVVATLAVSCSIFSAVTPTRRPVVVE
jgi:uncharacterized membrane protein YbaN (DUF454 family)